jgi:hypothetical protein
MRYAEKRMRAMCDLAADAFWKVQAVGKAFERLKALRWERKLRDRADEHRRKVRMGKKIKGLCQSEDEAMPIRTDGHPSPLRLACRLAPSH